MRVLPETRRRRYIAFPSERRLVGRRDLRLLQPLGAPQPPQREPDLCPTTSRIERNRANMLMASSWAMVYGRIVCDLAACAVRLIKHPFVRSLRPDTARIPYNRRMARRVLILYFTGLLLLNGAKSRDWMSGTIVDITAESLEAAPRVWPSLGGSAEDAPHGGGSWVAVPGHRFRELVVVDADSGARFVATRLIGRGKRTPITKLRQARFAAAGGYLFILDQKGREHKFTVRTTEPLNTRR